jgi:hypothetical protein
MSIRKICFSETPILSCKTPSKLIKTSNATPTHLTPFSHRSPTLSPSFSQTCEKSSPHASNLDQFCFEMEQKITKTREALLKNIQDTLEPPDPASDKVFHKSAKFVQRKQKIKENVKQNKYKKSSKLEKLKSVVEVGDKKDNKIDLLASHDVQNGEAADFLNINKRNFGETKRAVKFFPSKSKKKTSKLNSKPVKLTGRNSSLPEIRSPKLTPSSLERQFTRTERKSLDKNVSDSANNYIMTEMKKLWPPDIGEINHRKRKILKVKIDKLQSIIEEDEATKLEQELIYGHKNQEEQFKLDLLIHQHLRSLRKRLTLENL